MIAYELIKSFYENHLPNHQWQEHKLIGPCPVCAKQKIDQPGQLAILLNPESYFRGYFSCSSHCAPAGFQAHFARVMEIAPSQAPGFDPDNEAYVISAQYPARHLGGELDKFTALMGRQQYEHFARFHVSESILKQMGIGFNGRYLVYPYVQENGNAYAAHCILPGRPEDHFWHGNKAFAGGEFMLYNTREIHHCEGGALFITDSELDLLILKSLGYPAIAVPAAADLTSIAPQRLERIEHVFLLVSHTPEARAAAGELAVGLGYKARILQWPDYMKHGQHLAHLIAEHKRDAAKDLARMIRQSKTFSPFSSPEKESRGLQVFLTQEKGKTLLGLETGFAKLDRHLEGLRGINILGGAPKVGKSCFLMQMATEVARRKVPVIYYDFENGRQKIYLRTLVRLSRLAEKKIRSGDLTPDEAQAFEKASAELEALLRHFRVVTDRQLTSDTVKRHIEFLKHETQQEEALIVIDSLHKLPFKSLTERRTGIDSWLRNLEAIRDEQQACFLVISELSRGKSGGYGERPDLGSFKESGDIEYSADNAMVLMPNWDPMDPGAVQNRKSLLWVVASRESNPGQVAEYALDYPYWQFREI